MSEQLKVIDRDNVRWIEMNRPDSRNALTIDQNKAIIDALNTGEAAGARAIVLTGAGGSFCSGLDLKDAMRRGPSSPEDTEKNMREYFHGLIRAIRARTVPTIAAVDGVAAGFGFDLALACDVRLMSERARFGEIFVKRGLMPDGGGTFFLSRVVGLGRALDLMLTGDVLQADDAYRIGLGTRIFPEAEFEASVWAYAIGLAKGPPMALRLIKQAVYAGLDGDLDAALEREVEGQLKCLRSNDFFEGVAAFLQKREPRFRGE